ncbi:Ionotropic receptor 531 [Blattella germanica]|nr:Ionotropic receptor 531 [Blattella germanica]
MIMANKILIFIAITTANMIPQDDDNSKVNNFADCILYISLRYFDFSLPVAIQMSSMYHTKYETNTHENMLLNTISKENQFSRVTLGFIENMNNASVYNYNTGNEMKYGSYIIVLSGSNMKENFELTVKMMKRIFVGKNEKSKLLIILTNTIQGSHQQERVANILLQFVFKVGFVKTIVIIPTVIQDSNLELKILGWDPNSQSNICSLKLDQIKQLDTWIFKQRTFRLNADLFPEYRFVDMKGCKIFIGINHYYPFINTFFVDKKKYMDGSFPEVLIILQKLLNSSFRECPQKPFTNKMHARFPIFIGRDLQFNDCSYVYPYYTDDFYWYVPAPLEIPRWKSLIRAFKPEMWVFVSLAFILGTLILFYLQKFAKYSDSKTESMSLTNHFLSSMKTYLGLSTNVHYTGKIAILTFVLWLFYCLIINTAYQSALFGLIVNPGHYPAIKTLKELDESGLEKVRTYFSKEKDPNGLYSLYYNNFPPCSNNTLKCFKKIINERSHAVLASVYVGKKAIEEFTEFGLPLVRQIEEKYFTMYIVVSITHLSCMLKEPMEITVRRLVSAGLIEKWDSDFRIERITRITLNNDTSSVYSFGLNHLYGVFYISIFGLIVAANVFLIEIFLPVFDKVLI